MNSTTFLSDDAVPGGFLFSAVRAGLKASGRSDFACIVAPERASAAAMFTANRVIAAPLIVDKIHLSRTAGHIRVVAINAGNANCATGEAGLDAAKRVCGAAAETFGCQDYEVFPSSTGIIGVPLPAEKLVAALPKLQADMGSSAEHLHQLALAIMTTDTREKVAAATLDVGGKKVRIVAVGKGSGMIGPQLIPHATMLVYILTDAQVEPAALDTFLQAAVKVSFNCISVDGDTSTNDTVLLLASGASGAAIDAASAPAFQQALTQVCTSLAKQVVSDGEGITHMVELEIDGAPSDADALTVAKAIAHSPLVKTAWAGCDPNWGRLLSAAGASGVAIDPAKIDVWFGDLEICRDGGRSPRFDEAAAHKYLMQREYRIRLSLGIGAGRCRFWTTDLTTEYVHINADYST
ncbi:MAG TPA: bifunctional glutamate N-acetyltransferase/amino-acid acetyltransferase ArgJ [Acidisarcina sp.]|nr:bifunctional glutamate N-acetyltransferase/amino-acid acetyltransferase ArgJ [Acidisarcina sp.]